MNKLKLILITLVIVINFNKCKNPDKIINDSYIFDRYTKFIYNDKKQLIKELSYDIINHKDSLYSIKAYKYNDKGLKIKTTNCRIKHDFFDTQTFHYDSSGLILSNEGYNNDFSEIDWQYKYIKRDGNRSITTQYFIKNRLQTTSQYYCDTADFIYCRIDYDSKNRVVRIDTSIWIDKYTMQDYTIINGKKTLTSCRKIDNNRRIIERISYSPDKCNNEKNAWLYDKKGKEWIFMIIDKDGKLKSFAINIYDHDQLSKILWIKKNSII